MEYLIEFLEKSIDKYLFALIILSGIFITKYTKTIRKIRVTYKVLIASTIISIITFYINECDFSCLPKYVMTYTFATSFYEIFVRKIKALISNKLAENQ